MEYRKEINGLRAIAVILVILFHFEVPFFEGGYVGVDIFFVISGFIITSVSLFDIEREDFGVIRFYKRRVQRIVPALLAMLCIVYCTSYFIFAPSQHNSVGQYVVSSVWSATNILLLIKNRDYFGLENSENPLFHTWSLGVEEQFYLIFPIVLALFWNSTYQRGVRIAAITIASSLFLNYLFREYERLIFYFVVFRMWELGVGMLLAFQMKFIGAYRNKSLAFVGLLLVLWSPFIAGIAVFSVDLRVILAVLGTYLLIRYGTSEGLSGRLLTARMIMFLGTISYSLYLWHVPIKIYGDYLFEPNMWSIFPLAALLILVSWGSYRLIESPFRSRYSFRVTSSICVLVIGCLTYFGVLGYLNGGFPDRSQLFSQLKDNNGFGRRCNGNTGISLDCASSLSPNVAVMGNSYAMVYVTGLDDIGVNLVQLTQDSCALGYIDKVGDPNQVQTCTEFYLKSLKTIKDSPTIETVILSSTFEKEIKNDHFFSSFMRLLEDLKDKRVLVVGPPPRAPFNVGQCFIKGAIFSKTPDCNFVVDDNHNDMLNILNSKISKKSTLEFIDITETICPEGDCNMTDNQLAPVYVDTGHMSESGVTSAVGLIYRKIMQ